MEMPGNPLRGAMSVNACPRSALMAMALFCLLVAAACFQAGEGNGSDDDGSADDVIDDDSADDAGADHPCEEQYDVIVEGDYADEFDWVTAWTTKYVINEDGTTRGVVIPDAEGWPPYGAVGVRTAPGVGWSDGSFYTPQDLWPFCDGEIVRIHVEYVIENGVFQGQATWHCDNELGPYAIFGQVVCGIP